MSSINSTKLAARPRAAVRGSAPKALLVSALIGLGMLTACDGDNLFTGNPPSHVTGGAPVVASISVPDAIDEGGRLDIRVKAIAPGGMASVQIRYRRAVNEEQAFPTASRTDTVTVDAILQLPAQVQDSFLTIEAFATDQGGRVSEVVSRTIRVIDKSAPAVSVSLTPTRASMGDTVRVRVTAHDNAGLHSVGYALINQFGDTLPGLPPITVTGAAADTVFVIVLPPSLRPADLQVVGIAVNNAQLRGVSAPLQLSVVDLLPPTVRILTPQPDDSYPLSDSILVRVSVADSGGIAEVRLMGVAIRRDSLQNTSVVTRYALKVVPFPGLPGEAPPRDTTIVRYLLPVGGNASEDVYIVATARDISGNTRADTVRIKDGPRVQIMNPVDGATVGINRTLLVNVSASDRSAGLDSVRLVLSGVQNQTITLRNLFPMQVLDTTIAVNIGGTLGTLNMQPHVWNRNGIGGSGTLIRVNVSPVDALDTQRPQVSRRVISAERLELRDAIQVVVRATDGQGSGLARMGMVAVIVPDSDLLPSRQVFRSSAVFNPPLSGTPERTFSFTLGDVYTELESAYPRRFTVQVHAFAVDAAGNCGAAVGEQLASAACESVDNGGQTFYRARDLAPVAFQVTGTAGRSVKLPGGGRIADVVVDETRRRIYMSNIENNKIDIFMLGADTFAVTGSMTGRGLVGAAPWGMVISNGNDTLYVANSGGTNISVLPLDGPSWMIEDWQRRILTPNLVLTDVTMEMVEGKLRYVLSSKDYSDRPQFMAQHSSGTLFFSTLPTAAARDGTLRYVDRNAGPLPEIYLLHTGATQSDPASIALSQIDSVRIVRQVDGDRMVLFDRIPGTNFTVMSDTLPLDSALVNLKEKGSDVQWYPGKWDHAAMGLADTTYVAASRDGSTIAFGEGAKGPFGRVFLCCTINENELVRFGLSSQSNVTDLVNNAAERVFGVALNANGSLGVARGSQSAYYFDKNLRLQGEFRNGMANGAGGATLHPNHGGVLQADPIARLSFVPTSNRTIKIIDSVHYYERGDVNIRDNVVGPVRAFLPTSADNAGLSPGDPNYVVVRLVAVTAGSNVVIIDVRQRDIMN
ncbi:hypothetical protein BH23GEM9_BH23GEM9_15190 [soil metagenome]